MQRRTLLGLGTAGAAILALGGGLFAAARPAWEMNKLSPSGRELFSAVARAVLEGSLPAAPHQSAALNAHLSRLEQAVLSLHPATRAELHQLTALLAHPAGRRLWTGLVPGWDAATVPEVQAALQGLRESSLGLKQQTYHALRDLTNGSFFADSATWQALGYPGPRAL